jgi:hypothetical protein
MLAGISGVTQSSKGLTSITIAFNEALNAGSAKKTRLYGLLGEGNGGPLANSRHPTIKSAKYDSNTLSVTLKLARPYRGIVEVTVHPGLAAEDGTATNIDQVQVTE